MTDEEYDRLRFATYHDTVRRLGNLNGGGLTPPQLEVVRQDLLNVFAEVPADCEAGRTELLDDVCEGIARLVGGAVPDVPPDEAVR